MILEKNREQAERLIKFLIKNCELNNIIDTNKDEFGFWKAKWKDRLEKDYNIMVDYGLTKFVLYDVDWDFVIKFPFLEHGDYCALEYEKFQIIQREHMEQYFAEIEKVETDFYTYYLMERANVDPTFSNNTILDYYDTHEEEMDAIYYSDELSNSDYDYEGAETVVGVFGSYYTFELAQQLLFFCIDNRINDIHNSNVGYKCGRPLIIDYSGF